MSEFSYNDGFSKHSGAANQEYRSSTYGDKGYLFLHVDMTNPDTPLIKVRTWQPNEEDISKLYNACDFHR